MSEVKQKCCADKWPTGSYRSYPCGNNAKVERDGLHYCGKHDPVAIAERDRVKKEEFERKWKQRIASSLRAEAERKQKDHRAACFPDLLEALKWALARIEKKAPHQAIEGDGELYAFAAAMGAISKAEGGEA